MSFRGPRCSLPGAPVCGIPDETLKVAEPVSSPRIESVIPTLPPPRAAVSPSVPWLALSGGSVQHSQDAPALQSAPGSGERLKNLHSRQVAGEAENLGVQ